MPITLMRPGESNFTLQDFDSVSPEHPVAIDCASTGHCMWINSRAMRLLGVEKDHYPAEIWEGDGIVRDSCCAPTGKMEGHAWNWALRAVKPYTFEWYLRALETAQRDLLKVGITSAHNAWEDPYILNGWQTLERQGNLPGAPGQRHVELADRARAEHAVGIESVATLKAGDRVGDGMCVGGLTR